MIWKNLRFAALLFFSWLLLDCILSISYSPMPGIYYPAASGTLKSLPPDWTNKPWYGAPIYLMAFSCIWLLFVRKAGFDKGLRVAALVTAFAMAPFWIVSAISADMYELEVNHYWLASMIYANASFFIFGFIGRGDIEDLNF